MEFGSALKPARGGTAIDVEVVPGASESVFPSGYNPWRLRLQARVKAPPEGGAANAQLARIVARFFGSPVSAVSVSAGQASRQKTVVVAGLSLAEASAKLRAAP